MGAEFGSTLATSLLADQRSRWEREDRVPVEEFFKSHPALEENPEAQLDLIYAELLLRRERGEHPTADEYISRFPDLTEAIRTQFELDAAIDLGATQWADTPNPLGPGGSAPPKQVGRFQVERELGRGGFGIVYLAFDPQLGRHVALKVPRADVVDSAELRQRFQQEARAAAVLDHPNLVPIYEAGEIGSLCYIISAYCPGINLANWLHNQSEPVPFADAARLVRSLADGVQHSHSKGILHRDLKPGNILLVASPAGADDASSSGPRAMLNAFQPKITDFGLARLSGGEQHTKTGAAIGTPSYMAPEQATGSRSLVGPATDVYSLGVILYELLTGRTPFVADSPVEILLAVQREDPVPPSRLRQRLPRDLETICLKCLEKEPHRRYQSAGALGDDLGRYLSDESIIARPIGPMGRSVRWARRHQAIAALITILAFTMTAGVGGITWQWWRAENHARQADFERDVADRERFFALQAQQNEADVLDRHRIRRAYDEWESDNLQAARDLLRDASRRKDTWEYRYVERLCNLGLFVVDQHEAGIAGAGFSADGKKLISGDRSGVILIRDVASGKTDRVSIPLGHESVSRVAVGGVDGGQVAATTTGGMIRIWDLQEQKVTGEWQAHDPGYYGPVVYSPRGHFLATAADKSVKIWDVATKTNLYSYTNSHSVTDMSWSPDERYLAVSAYAMTQVRIWEVATGKETTIPTVRWMATSVAFSPDGKRFAWAGMDGVVSVHDVTLNFNQLTTLAGSPGYQSCLLFSPDGRMIVAGARNGPARMWNVETGQLALTIHGHSSGVRDAAFSPDGSLLATVGTDRRIVVWDVLDYQDVSTMFEFSPLRLNAAAFSPDAKRLVTATQNFRLWDVERRSAIYTAGNRTGISVAFHPNGEQFAGGDETGRVYIFGKSDKPIPARQMKGYPFALKYVDGGRRILVAGWNNAVYSWEPGSPAEPDRILGPLGTGARKWSWDGDCLAAFDATGDRLVYCERGQAPAVWDVLTRQKTVTLDEAPRDISAIAIDRDGRQVALGARTGEIQIRDAKTGQLAAKLLGHPLGITSLSFTPDGLRLASVAADGVVKFWDSVAAVEVLSLRGHATYDTVLTISPNGEHCLVGGWDGFLRMWSIDDPHAEPAAIRTDRRTVWHRFHSVSGFSTKRWHVAAHHCSQLIELDRDNWLNYNRRGWSFAELGQWERAAPDFEKAMELPNCNPMVFSNRADIYLRQRDLEGYQRVCRLTRQRYESSTDADEINSLLWICVLDPSAAGMAKELLPVAKAALARATPKAREELLNTVGAVFYRAGELDEGIKHFHESMKLQRKGGYFEDWVFLAMAYQKQGESDKAKEFFDRVTEGIKKLDTGTAMTDGRTMDWRLRIELPMLAAEANAVRDQAKK